MASSIVITFGAHIELLCVNSAFFDNALNGHFVEASTRKIPLPDDDPDAFAEFLAWLYTGRVFQSERPPSWSETIFLWILADKYEVPALCNAVVLKMAEKFTQGRFGNMTPGLVEYLYENSMQDSVIRRLAVDICAWGMDIKMFEAQRSKFHSEFIEDFAIVQMKRVRKQYLDDKAPFEVSLQQYLVNTEPRMRKKERDQTVKIPEDKGELSDLADAVNALTVKISVVEDSLTTVEKDIEASSSSRTGDLSVVDFGLDRTSLSNADISKPATEAQLALRKIRRARSPSNRMSTVHTPDNRSLSRSRTPEEVNKTGVEAEDN